MKMKKLKAVTLIILNIITMVILTGSVFAANEKVKPGDYAPSSQTEATNAGKIQSIGNSIIGVIQIVGSIVAVATLAVIGIRYMLGSVEERAEYKKSMLPYFIGAIMLFAIITVVTVIQGIATSIAPMK